MFLLIFNKRKNLDSGYFGGGGDSVYVNKLRNVRIEEL